MHQLPVDDSVKASILLLQSVPPVVKPIHQLLETPKKSEAHTPQSLVIVSNDLRPVSIQRNSTSPVAAGLQEHFDRHRSFADILSDVCKDYKRIQVIRDTPKGVVAFAFKPKTDSPVAYLIAHSTLKVQQEFVTSLSTLGLESKVPLAIMEVSPNSQGARFVPSEGSEQIKLDRSSDTTLSYVVYQIAGFVALPGKKSTYMIAGDRPLIQSMVEQAAEPDDRISTTDNIARQNQDVDEYLINATSSTLEESANLAEHPTPELSEIPELISDDGDSIQSGFELPVSRTLKPVSFLSWLKRFFVGFWSWLFAPFGLKRLGAQKTDGDHARSGTVTPNEKTHLLSVSCLRLVGS